MTDSRRVRVRRRLITALADNFALKLVSVTLAFFLWAWVQSEQVVERRTRARVQYKWPETLVRTSEVPKTLVVTVSGPQGLVRTLKERRLLVSVDLSESEEGAVSLDFTERTIVGLPNGLEVVQVSPPAVDFQLDQRLSRTVPVKAAVMGDPAEGWRRESVSVSPDTVEITGPQSLVRNITEVSTDIIDISGLRGDKSYSVPLAIAERTVTPTSKDKLTVEVDVSPIIDTRVFEGVPVLPRAREWVANVGEAVVELEGPVRELGQIKSEQINIVVHLPEVVEVGGGPVKVSFDPGSDENLIEVVHQGPKDTIRVVRVQPSTISLVPAQ